MLTKSEVLNELNETLKEYCCETKTHGLSNIVKTKSVIFRFVWIFSFLIALASSMYCNNCSKRNLNKENFINSVFKISFSNISSKFS